MFHYNYSSSVCLTRAWPLLGVLFGFHVTKVHMKTQEIHVHQMCMPENGNVSVAVAML